MHSFHFLLLYLQRNRRLLPHLITCGQLCNPDHLKEFKAVDRHNQEINDMIYKVQERNAVLRHIDIHEFQNIFLIE